MRPICAALGLTAAACISSSALASVVMNFNDITNFPGLSGQAEFTLVNPTTLEIRLQNTSTGAPGGFDSAAVILTGISFDLGAPGAGGGDPSITGGTAVFGASSFSVNFDTGSYGPGTDAGGEWGYGNGGATGMLVNYISGNAAGVTAFGGPNLDGTAGLNGPQAGLISAANAGMLGGLGAIQDEIVVTLTLSSGIADLSFLDNGHIIEFGSDAAFMHMPTPGSITLLGIGGLMLARRRRA